MRLSQLIAATVLSGVAAAGFACELPPLMAVPPKDQAAGQADKLRAEWDSYYQAMSTYTSCVQAELTAAGGDTAPTITKTVLVQRNNSAVAEVSAVKKLLDEALGPTVVPATEFSGGTPPPGNQADPSDRGRRRDN
jgi:hypothetical protein